MITEFTCKIINFVLTKWKGAFKIVIGLYVILIGIGLLSGLNIPLPIIPLNPPAL